MLEIPPSIQVTVEYSAVSIVMTVLMGRHIVVMIIIVMTFMCSFSLKTEMAEKTKKVNIIGN